jgi:hypothetical protein
MYNKHRAVLVSTVVQMEFSRVGEAERVWIDFIHLVFLQKVKWLQKTRIDRGALKQTLL